MSSMVERVARAIYQAIENRPDYARPMNGLLAEDLAIAAIEAMREPTEGMLGAVYGMCADQRASDRQAREVWQGMLDEALK